MWMTYLCSANPDVRAHWKRGLGANDPMIEVGSVAGLNQAVAGSGSELLLLHMDLPALNGLPGIQQLCLTYPDVRILILSDQPDESVGIKLLKAGVRGIANTYTNERLLTRAIAAIKAGEIWVGRRLMTRLIEATARAQNSTNNRTNPILQMLTDREREIAQHVGQGASNKRIAQDLGITERTVKAHLSSIFDKTEVGDRLQLALLVNGVHP